MSKKKSMVYKVVHSPLAERTFLQNITYLEEYWTSKEIMNFIIKTSDVVDLLKMDPYIFPKWENNTKINKVVLIKQITMFYEIKNNNVLILLFWNNYQDPDKIMTLLK